MKVSPKTRILRALRSYADAIERLTAPIPEANADALVAAFETETRNLAELQQVFDQMIATDSYRPTRSSDG